MQSEKKNAAGIDRLAEKAPGPPIYLPESRITRDLRTAGKTAQAAASVKTVTSGRTLKRTCNRCPTPRLMYIWRFPSSAKAPAV